MNTISAFFKNIKLKIDSALLCSKNIFKSVSKVVSNVFKSKKTKEKERREINEAIKGIYGSHYTPISATVVGYMADANIDTAELKAVLMASDEWERLLKDGDRTTQKYSRRDYLKVSSEKIVELFKSNVYSDSFDSKIVPLFNISKFQYFVNICFSLAAGFFPPIRLVCLLVIRFTDLISMMAVKQSLVLK